MIDYPENWYGPAIQAGIRPIRLIGGTKSCPSGTWEDHILRSVDEVRLSFDQGFNVGFLLVGKGGTHPNPLGAWVNDIDSQAALDRFGDHQFNLMVTRNHRAKRHLYGRLPDPSLPRRSRLIRKSHDVKLTGIVVGPGSRHQEGGIYSGFQRNPDTGLWEPWDGAPIDWSSLPVVDPTPFMPPPKLIKLSRQQAINLRHSVKAEWVFEGEDAPTNPSEVKFTTAQGLVEDRIFRGEGYVRNRLRCKIVSRSGNGGRATLLVIATHLVQYLRLPELEALKLLHFPVYGQMCSWNSQCTFAESGERYPWSTQELESAIAAAHHYIPAYGVMEYENQERRRAANERLADLWTLIGHIPPQDDPAPAMSAQEVYKTFKDLYSVDPVGCSYRRFCCAMQKAIRAGLVSLSNCRGGGRKKLRYYRGISPDLLELALEFRSEEESDERNAA